MKTSHRHLTAFCVGTAIALCALEILLGVFNPFGFRVKGDQIHLPALEKYEIKNDVSEKLDRLIIHTKNSLGFRGPEPPEGFDRVLSIVAIGGSTTEGFYLSDGRTWPDRLQKKLDQVFESVWLNNAGLSGHSTFGHLILMNDYIGKLRPKVAL